MINEQVLRKQLEGMTKEQRAEYFARLQESVETASPFERPVNWPKTTVKNVNKEAVEVPYTCIENTEALLEHYGISVRYNEMSKEIDIDIPGQVFHRDTELNTKLTWIINEAHHKGYPKNEIDEHIAAIASNNAFHPVKDWILSKPWDGTSRLNDFYNSIESDTDIRDMLMRKWGIMAVAAVFSKDGIRPQGILTFEGKQGLGKTTWLSSIIGDPAWIAEGQSLDPHDKDSVLDVVCRWIVELGEIQSTFKKTDLQALKAFITKNEDRIRPPYAAKANEYARRTVFFGTVDDPEFLTADNGTRRFWVISVKDVNVNHKIDTQQLWAEFYELYRTGEPFWFDREEIALVNDHNRQFTTIDHIEETMQDAISKPDPGKGEWVSVTDMLKRLGKDNPKQNDLNAAGKFLRKIGCERQANTKKWYVAIDNDIRVAQILRGRVTV